MQRSLLLLQHPHGLFHVGPGQGEADVLAGIPPNGLDDGVHVDARLSQQGEHAESNPWTMVQPHHRDAGNTGILRHARDICLFHFDDLLDFRAGFPLQTGHDFHVHMIFFGQLHAAVVEYLGPLAGQLQHFIIGDLLQLHRAGGHPRVRGIHAVHIGVDLAQVRAEGGGQSHGAGVGPAPAQGGHVAEAVDSLEASHQDDLVLVQLPLDALGIDLLDAGVGIGAGGLDAHLPGGKAHHRQAHVLQRHSAQGDGDLLSGTQEHIHFPL